MMDEGLELALGWHYANNLTAALFVTADWTALQTDSIYKFVGEPDVSFSNFTCFSYISITYISFFCKV